MRLQNLLAPLAGASIVSLAGAQISFGPAQNQALVGLRPSWVTPVDVDGDGDEDLAVTSGTLSGGGGPDYVEIFLNSGGSFTPGQLVFVGNNVSTAALVAADFDGDGDEDLAVSLQNSNAVMVLQNVGGVFGTSAMVGVGGSEPRHMIAADIDGDGDQDLVTSNRSSNNLSLLTNVGGTFSLAGTIATGAEPRYVLAADLTGDCTTDLAVAVSDDRRVEIFAGSGNGTFGAAQLVPIPGNEKPSGLAAGDVDGDGDLDLFASVDVNDAGAIALLRNLGGTFAGQLFFTGGINPGAVVAADLDDDGDVDVATGDEVANDVDVLANVGGSLGAAASFATGAHVSHVTCADFDGNGSIDLATVNRDSNNLSVLLNASSGGAKSYCTAGANSVGSGARIGRTGSTSIAANGFALTVSCAAPSQPGLFYYGPGQLSVPFGEGTRCVGGQAVRLSPAQPTDAQGRATRALDFNSAEAAGIGAGTTWNFQFWYRDPAGGGSSFNLSDGLQATFRM